MIYQFGFKPSLSTTLCTGVVKGTVSQYLSCGSNVYGCLIDASKAFDTLDHSLLEKLKHKKLPVFIYYTLFYLLTWYHTQLVQVCWNAALSQPFSVSQGVQQGGVLSPILLSLYIDNLLQELADSGIGCHWDNLFVGALAYANYLTILTPSPSALKNCCLFVKNSGLLICSSSILTKNSVYKIF